MRRAGVLERRAGPSRSTARLPPRELEAYLAGQPLGKLPRGAGRVDHKEGRHRHGAARVRLRRRARAGGDGAGAGQGGRSPGTCDGTARALPAKHSYPARHAGHTPTWQCAKRATAVGGSRRKAEHTLSWSARGRTSTSTARPSSTSSNACSGLRLGTPAATRSRWMYSHAGYCARAHGAHAEGGQARRRRGGRVDSTVELHSAGTSGRPVFCTTPAAQSGCPHLASSVRLRSGDDWPAWLAAGGGGALLRREWPLAGALRPRNLGRRGPCGCDAAGHCDLTSLGKRVRALPCTLGRAGAIRRSETVHKALQSTLMHCSPRMRDYARSQQARRGQRRRQGLWPRPGDSVARCLGPASS